MISSRVERNSSNLAPSEKLVKYYRQNRIHFSIFLEKGITLKVAIRTTLRNFQKFDQVSSKNGLDF